MACFIYPQSACGGSQRVKIIRALFFSYRELRDDEIYLIRTDRTLVPPLGGQGVGLRFDLNFNTTWQVQFTQRINSTA